MTYAFKSGGKNPAQITLSTPIWHDGRELHAIDFKPTKKDAKQFNADLTSGRMQVGAFLAYLSRATRLPLSVVRQIRESDLSEIHIAAKGDGQSSRPGDRRVY